ALRLGDDLLADDEEVASGERRGLARRRLDDEARDVGAEVHLGDARDADHLVTGRPGAGAHRSQATLGGTGLAAPAPASAHARTRRALSVTPPSAASAARSSEIGRASCRERV